MNNWTLREAIELCVLVEKICPDWGCHVGLTGGLLYKEGDRKDLDLVFYRIRQVEGIDKVGLFDALSVIGINHLRGFGFVHKAEWIGKPIDCLFPEEDRVCNVKEEDQYEASKFTPSEMPKPAEPLIEEMVKIELGQG